MKAKNKAFTLVELLVVISIIALLLAVLIPSLNKAREQAKVMSCAANCKQISYIIQTYQAENDGAVPVMLNRFTIQGDTANGPYPARSRLLSVALIAGTKDGSKLAKQDVGEFNPDLDWGSSSDRRTKSDYFKMYLPKFYVCPFVRDRDAASQQDYVQGPDISLNGHACRSFIRTTSGESYSVWRWELVKDVRPHNYGNDLYTILGPPYGTPRYGALCWNNYPDLNTSKWSVLDGSPVKWGSRQLRQIGVGSVAEATIVYCEQGQTDSHTGGPNPENGIYNYGSHKKKGIGGTNVVFADGHVGWVEGTRVGWP